MELTERIAVEQAFEEMNSPTSLQHIVAFTPIALSFLSSAAILFDAEHAKGTLLDERMAPQIATILSASMLSLTLMSFCYRGHSYHEPVRSIMAIIFRINLIQTIVCSGFISYLKNGGEYATYFLWVYLLTVPILILSVLPLILMMI